MTTVKSSSPNTLENPDGFYQAMVAAHDGLDVEQSLALNARLILLMAQQIGDDDLLQQLLREAAAPTREA
jgi:hypothetical protein